MEVGPEFDAGTLRRVLEVLAQREVDAPAGRCLATIPSPHRVESLFPLSGLSRCLTSFATKDANEGGGHGEDEGAHARGSREGNGREIRRVDSRGDARILDELVALTGFHREVGGQGPGRTRACVRRGRA